MISVTELRAGRTFEDEGEPFLVLKYEHVKLGRGTANIKVKVRNLRTGAIIEKTFISGARVQEISTIKRKLRYLYQEGRNFYFIDPKNFEQFEIPEESISDQVAYLSEGVEVEILFWNGKPLSLELPPKMEFTVVETGPGVRGDSATNIYKSATLNNSLKIKVPLFINEGDKILVDTRSGEYVERVRS
jgi:elongation factor P